jgi:hypothetical protein
MPQVEILTIAWSILQVVAEPSAPVFSPICCVAFFPQLQPQWKNGSTADKLPGGA